MSKEKSQEVLETGGVIRLKPQQYIHILDNNSGVTRLEVGPQTITLGEGERLVLQPQRMIIVPPRHYCSIANPVMRNTEEEAIADRYGQVRLRYGDREYRFEQEPFALYPGEQLLGSIKELLVVKRNQALRLQATRDFTETIAVTRVAEDMETIEPQSLERLAGDEWLFEGPGTYTPRVEVEILEIVNATIIKPNQALCLRARQDCIDRQGNPRIAGEKWLVREAGAYLPGVDEEVGAIVEAYVLTEHKALYLQAKRTFTDVFDRDRKAGDEWLVTYEDASTHIPDVYEEAIAEVEVTTLNERQWCVIVNPIDENGKPQLGRREIRQGRTSFFLHPGEYIETEEDLDPDLKELLELEGESDRSGIRDVYILGEREALLLRAKERLTETGGTAAVTRQPGDLWNIYGPRDYVPPLEVEVVEKREAISLDRNEGIYVRNIQTGELSLIRGPQAYLLTPYQELWEKEIPQTVEEILTKKLDPLADRGRYRGGHNVPDETETQMRDKTRAVVFQVPQNGAVQVHNYKERTARIVFGPDLVMLEPQEEVTVLSLSGSVPKRPHVIKALALLLGPDFMTDMFAVETLDHARLQLRLSYNWYFDVDRNNEAEAAKLFQVPDFVNAACKAIASQVRGAVAGVSFEQFHRQSAQIIREAVFGSDEGGSLREEFRFSANNLVITNVDIQSVEPVDEETLKSLQKSVQLAIKITTDAQEAAARNDAKRIEQEAKARLERQGIVDESAAETERRGLLELQAENAAVEATGRASAESRAKVEMARIEGEAAITLAQQEAEAARIRFEAESAIERARQEAQIEYQEAFDRLELEKANRLAQMNGAEFREKVEALGAETIRAIAQAGPEMQARLLEGLGIESVLITDGKSPINLFGTARGLINSNLPEPDSEGNG